MGTYRISRNIEASYIDFIKNKLQNAGWNNIEVEKVFSRAYELPSEKTVIVTRVFNSIHNKVQIGSNATMRNVSLYVHIFATSDGLKLDLKDFIISVTKNGFDLYEYTIQNDVVSKTLIGKIQVSNIIEQDIYGDIDKSSLDVHDRFRYLLIFNLRTNRVEV